MARSEDDVIFRRYRRTKDGQLLDARDYGYWAWRIPIRKRKNRRK